MALYLVGSNRKKNCFDAARGLAEKNDDIMSLAGADMKYCLRCDKCSGELKDYCIIKDDMQQLYYRLLDNDKIVIISPIYFAQIPGILKNTLDRLNPFCHHELLKGKEIYLILVDEETEKESKDAIKNIVEFFEKFSDSFGCGFEFLKYFVSSDNYNIKNKHQKELNRLKDKMCD